MTKGVITGDLVNSTNIATEWRRAVAEALNTCVSDFRSLTPIKIEMYRGDSFQIVVDKAEQALPVAIALRSKLRASTPEGNDIWDARVSIGIGDISFESDNVATSDGEAFWPSGRAFDAIGKKRLSISTPWPELDVSMESNTRFADEIISSWTARQARVVYHSISLWYIFLNPLEKVVFCEKAQNSRLIFNALQIAEVFLGTFSSGLILWKKNRIGTF